jgi:hypothetical protein
VLGKVDPVFHQSTQIWREIRANKIGSKTIPTQDNKHVNLAE